MTDFIDHLGTILDAMWDEKLPGPAPLTFDRSLIELFTVCPWQGWCTEHGYAAPVGLPAVSGQAAHDGIGAMVNMYAGGQCGNQRELVDEAVNQLLITPRGDVAPDAMEGVRWSLYPISTYLLKRSPLDILRYDGGQGERSGQISAVLVEGDEKRQAVIITSEIDLLVAGATDTELAETDWKTGHKVWTSTDVKESFQFQLHAWLVFANYPECEYLHTRVYNSRFRSATPWVTFRRDETFRPRLLTALMAREGVIRAVTAALRALGGETDPSVLVGAIEGSEAFLKAVTAADPDVCWPQELRCAICSAWWCCPATAAPVFHLANDPVRYLRDTEAMQVAVANRLGLLRTYADAHGGELADGQMFSADGPKKITKPKITQYKAWTDNADMQEADDGS